jgi:hypothetical protein
MGGKRHIARECQLWQNHSVNGTVTIRRTGTHKPPRRRRALTGERMPSIRIDVQEIIPDLFESTDSEVLIDALLAATDPQRPVADHAVFENSRAVNLAALGSRN